MIEYKISKAIKNHTCKNCKIVILQGENYFIHLDKSNTLTLYNKYCLSCALQQFSDEPIQIQIKNSFNQRKDFKEPRNIQLIYGHLSQLEKKKQLTFLRVTIDLLTLINKQTLFIGRKGFPDFLLFFKEGKTIFLEIKSSDDSLSSEQLNFQSLVNNLGYEYYLIRNIIEFYNLINKFL